MPIRRIEGATPAPVIDVNGKPVKLWNHGTIADGVKLTVNTLGPICSAINDGYGDLSAAIDDEKDLIITSNKGVTTRIHASEISVSGRNTQGVILVRLKDNQIISNIALVAKEAEEIENQENVENVEQENTNLEAPKEEAKEVTE